jgi:subtilisin family serine protease
MIIKKHNIVRKIWFFPFWKWLALILLILCLSCFLFKCCINQNATVSESGISSDPNLIALDNLAIPDQVRSRPRIDTSKIIIDPDDPVGRKVVSDIINIYLQDSADIQVFARKLAEEHPSDRFEVTYYAEEYKRLQLRVEMDRKEFIFNELKTNYASEVKYVIDEWVLNNAELPSDPGYQNESAYWFYNMIGLSEAWDSFGLGSSSIVVAVIDDSFDLDHVEFTNQIVDQWNVFNYSDQLYANNYSLIHGTHVAGTIGANADNGQGICGVAPNCKIMPIQISDETGIITTSSLLDGIFYALLQNADVINMSIALSMLDLDLILSPEEQELLIANYGLDEAKMWNEVYAIAEKEHTTIVQAAGNDGVLAAIDPMKRSDNTLVVGSTNSNGNVSDFSNIGSRVDVFAPGEAILSSVPGNQFDTLTGTSMASPIVAGCIALIKSKIPDISINEIHQLIRRTGKRIEGERGRLIRINKILEELS